MGLFSRNKKSKQVGGLPEKDIFERTFEKADYEKKRQVDIALQNQPKSISENHKGFVSDFDEVLSLKNQNVPVQKTQRIVASKAPKVPPDASAENVVLVGTSSVIGRRDSQQDALAVSDNIQHAFKNKWLAVLCDGMGGMNGGEQASVLCVKRMLEAFDKNDKPIPEFYRNNVVDIDRAVASLQDENGDYLGAGSTLVSVVIDGNHLYWCSVGDSHIYIIRNNEMALVNTEHNYMLELLKRVEQGEITLEEANKDKSKDALISYMGIGAISLMDIIEKPFQLAKGDYIVLSSDGLYRSVSDEEIFNIVKQNGFDMQKAAEQLTECALSKNNPYQDNTSVITIRYQ